MKKHIISSVILAITLICSHSLFAEEKTSLSLFLQTDAAYYPESKRITGDSHFAPITGAYSGLEGAVTFGADYKIATPLGENWLVSDANIVLGGGIEVTPISVKPKASVQFTPVPFLVFKVGGAVGWGWNIGGIEGLCELNKTTCEYEAISTFDHPYYDVWGSATFQFDTGALISGDWSHVVILASYSTTYSGIAGLDADSIYEWQCGANQARGLKFEAQGILGYQMPIPLHLAGIMVKAGGHYDGADYGKFDENYDGAFVTVNVSPVMQFQFGEKDDLYCLFEFSSRRSFNAEYEKAGESLYLKKTGREWYFQRLALSWTHRFM